jgi:hypothetical protein
MATQRVEFDTLVSATLTASMVQTDYGVPGSPVWYEPEDIEFADYTVCIAGVEVKLKDLPKSLVDALLEEAVAESENGEWE